MRRYLPPLRKLRKARTAQEAAHIAWMYQTYPWMSGYAVFCPGRDWHAVHLASSALLPPARTPQALQGLILADVQSRPVPVRGCDENGEWTRVNIPRAQPRTGGRTPHPWDVS